MNGYQIGTLVLAALLCFIAYLDYKEQKRFNDVVLAPKKPCSCKDHAPTATDTTTVDNMSSGPSML